MFENDLRYFVSGNNWWKYDPKNFVLPLIKPNESVLDVGCSFGSFGEALIKRGVIVDGIENYAPAVVEAKKVLRNVFNQDLNYLCKDEINITDIRYDVITCMDVLEHCVDPECLLKFLTKYLKEEGRIYISLPNVANIHTRYSVLLGNWDYEEYGVMDKTHVRFFTKKTSLELVKKFFNGVSIIAKTPVLDLYYNKRWFTKINLFLTNCFPGLFALQFVIEGRCVKKNEK